MAIPSEGLRICTKCRSPKENSTKYFYMRHGWNGTRVLATECKACTRERTKSRYEDKKDTIRPAENAKKRAMGLQLKNRVFNHYGGWICACCGEAERLFLTLDHINNDGAEFRRMITGDQSRGGGQITYRWLEKNGYPSGYQVMCSNCQHGKRMNSGVCPHQTTFNDQPRGVGSSEPKRNGSQADHDMVFSSGKLEAVQLNRKYFEKWIH